MDKELLESVMKLRGIEILTDSFDDDEFRTTWTFVIKGLPIKYSVAKHAYTEAAALKQAREIVYMYLTQGE